MNLVVEYLKLFSFCQNRTPLQKTMSKIFLWELFFTEKMRDYGFSHIISGGCSDWF